MNRDRLPRCWRIRQVLLDQIVGVEFAALFEQQHGRGGELLGDRPDAKSGIHGIRDLPFQIGEAIRPAEDHGAVLRHEHCPHEPVVASEILDDLVHPIRILGSGRPRNKREDHGDPQQLSNVRDRHRPTPVADYPARHVSDDRAAVLTDRGRDLLEANQHDQIPGAMAAPVA